MLIESCAGHQAGAACLLPGAVNAKASCGSLGDGPVRRVHAECTRDSVAVATVLQQQARRHSLQKALLDAHAQIDQATQQLVDDDPCVPYVRC